jgi:hypothetical protein
VNIFTESSIHNPYLNLKRVISSAQTMRVSLRLLISPAMTIALTATVVAIAIILLTANIPITNAQQQQQQQQQQQPTSSDSERNNIIPKYRRRYKIEGARRLGNS